MGLDHEPDAAGEFHGLLQVRGKLRVWGLGVQASDLSMYSIALSMSDPSIDEPWIALFQSHGQAGQSQLYR